MNARRRAIRYIEDCRDIHQQWIVANPKGVARRIGGDRTHHRKWVRRYNRVLKVLRGSA